MDGGSGSGMENCTDEKIVQTALLTLLSEHVGPPASQADIEIIDDIVLSYVVGILQDLVAADDDEDFDSEGFCEMLVAYLPQAEAIPSQDVIQWMLNLVRQQRIVRIKRQTSGFNFDLRSVIEETVAGKASGAGKSGGAGGGGALRSKTNSESSCGSSSVSGGSATEKKQRVLSETSSDEEEFQALVGRLLEMFPYSCELEVSHCLTLMNCNVERASNLIMHRYEAGQSLQPNQKKPKVRMLRDPDVDEKVLRQRIVGKYGYVDKEEDARYHRPMVKKEDDKKMIRYRDGKIVSTKGERFTQVTKQESEEMKKSYVNNPFQF